MFFYLEDERHDLQRIQSLTLQGRIGREIDCVHVLFGEVDDLLGHSLKGYGGSHCRHVARVACETFRVGTAGSHIRWVPGLPARRGKPPPAAKAVVRAAIAAALTD